MHKNNGDKIKTKQRVCQVTVTFISIKHNHEITHTHTHTQTNKQPCIKDDFAIFRTETRQVKGRCKEVCFEFTFNRVRCWQHRNNVQTNTVLTWRWPITRSQTEESEGRKSARETFCPKLFTPKSLTWVWLLLYQISTAVKEEEVQFSFNTPHAQMPLV